VNIHGRFFCFDEKLAGAADPKTVIGGLGESTHFNGILVNNVFIGIGIALLVIHIPAQRLEERV